MPRLEKRNYRVSNFTANNDLPHLSQSRQVHKTKSAIDDFEGLFINYGWRETSYPYTQQNAYTEEKEQEITVAVLENEYLYAEFLPTLGGRLWKLYDKKKQKDILYTNDVIRFRNLSIRNAWFSGGVEWNCGIMGHSPFTCSQMYCAFVTGKNGEDVLRFYEFERTREIYYQIDFWLDKNKLMTAVRIENPNTDVVPMYWWSTMATPEYKGGRVVVPASSAYNNSDGMGIKKSSIPFDNGIDVSYPENIPNTVDYFYDISPDEDKFIANVDRDGFGLLQFSSNNLKGRKLFSWGHRKGSNHWQRMLTDKAGDYVEIQAGLGKTQYECIPMPPKTVWTFSECYTLADIPKEKATADYTKTVMAIKEQIKSIGDSDYLDSRLSYFTESISLQKGKTVLTGSGFGYLNGMLNGKVPSQLEFTQSDDIKGWLSLINGEDINCDLSFAFGEKKESLLLKNQNICNWNIPYQLSLLSYDRRDFDRAKMWCEKSLILDSNAKNNHLYAHILYQLCDDKSVYFAKKCLRFDNNNYALTESIFTLLLKLNAYDVLIDEFDLLDDVLKSNQRLLMYLSMSYLKSGDAKGAEKILTGNGGLNVLDFREGDKFLDELYRGIRKELYSESDSEITVPEQYDFIVFGLKN
ncbi:MAG: DUF5107 domain-containing protein [Eubacterium sp.]